MREFKTFSKAVKFVKGILKPVKKKSKKKRSKRK